MLNDLVLQWAMLNNPVLEAGDEFRTYANIFAIRNKERAQGRQLAKIAGRPRGAEPFALDIVYVGERDLSNLYNLTRNQGTAYNSDLSNLAYDNANVIAAPVQSRQFPECFIIKKVGGRQANGEPIYRLIRFNIPT